MGLFKYFSKDKPKDEQDSAVKAFDASPGPLSELAVPSKPKNQPRKRHNPLITEEDLAVKVSDSKKKDEETQYWLQDLASKYTTFEQKYLEDEICGVVSDKIIDDFLNTILEKQNLEARLVDQPIKEWSPKEKETMREYLKHVTPLMRKERKEMYERNWSGAGKGAVAGFVSSIGSTATFVVYNGQGDHLTDQQAGFCVGAGILAGFCGFMYFVHSSEKSFQKKWAKATQKYVKKLKDK